MHLGAQGPLSMHGIQGEDAPFDISWCQERAKRTNLILFLLDVAMPQHNASRHFVTTELMNWLRLRTGGTNGFAIDGQMGMIRLSLRSLQAARFVSTSALRLPSHKEGAQQLIQSFPVHHCQHMAVGGLTGHILSSQPKALRQ